MKRAIENHNETSVAFLTLARLPATAKFFKRLIYWSGREDLNLRPPGPEPDARHYCVLLKSVVCKRLILKLLLLARCILLRFTVLKEFDCREFTSVFFVKE